MKIRFFGSANCRDCLKVFIILEKTQVYYEYIDSDDESDKVQNFCDKHNVDRLPHLQFLDNDDQVIVEHIGDIDEKEFKNYLIKFFPDY